MDRDEIVRLLADSPSEAAHMAGGALAAGASCIVWDGSVDAASLAQIYERRLRHTLRTRQLTLDLAEAVGQLRRFDRPALLGRIDNDTWVFMIFLAADSRALIACTAVERRKRDPS